MLETISISCPKCREQTDIAVSRGRRSGAAYTSCRRCGAHFIPMTQEDGRVLLIDGDTPLDPATENPNVLAVINFPVGKSGYRVLPPENLGIFDRGIPPPAPQRGPSDEELLTSTRVVFFDQILRRPDGSPRPPVIAAKVVGRRSLWLAQLGEALTARYAAPPPLSFPPAIFISYRWGTPEANAWVAELAHNLKGRGYPVTFDRDEPETVDVPTLVSKIADCRYFIAVLDAGYAQRLGGAGNQSMEDGWVFDEHQTALTLSNHGQLRIVGFLRSGPYVPMEFEKAEPGHPGNTVDVRTAEQLALVLDDVFPPIEDAPSEETALRARALLGESYEHLIARRFPEAYAAAEELSALLPGVIDGLAQKIRVTLQAGWAREGLAATVEALALAPRSRELLLAAGTFAQAAGNAPVAVRYLASMLEMYGRQKEEPDVAIAHHALGSSLDDLDQVYPALAHLELAREADPANCELLVTLGFVYRRANEPERAVECFEAGLAHDANHPGLLLNLTTALIECGRFADARRMFERFAGAAPDHPQLPELREVVAGLREGERIQLVAVVRTAPDARWIRCSTCKARVPLDSENEMFCARCGSVLSRTMSACPCCTHDGFVLFLPEMTIQCPYCRAGRLSIAES